MSPLLLISFLLVYVYSQMSTSSSESSPYEPIPCEDSRSNDDEMDFCQGGGRCEVDDHCLVANVTKSDVAIDSIDDEELTSPDNPYNRIQSGQCNDGKCECNAGYSGSHCHCSSKVQSTAFTLSLLMGAYGVDRFYLGYTEIGILKAILTLIMCCVPCLPLYRRCATPDRDSKFSALGSCCFFCLAYLAVAAWWAVDWVLILTRQLPDGRGCELSNDLLPEVDGTTIFGK